ncbi:MAG TPA: heme exporter protein CcmD [Gammaproteobacteria bacterium]|nr:heme exporter protein CcmD [Gammaproteobacteria bacterium]
MPAFLDMGHYAPYVWGSYGVVAGFMLIEVILLITKRKSLVKSLTRLARLNREKGHEAET